MWCAGRWQRRRAAAACARREGGRWLRGCHGGETLLAASWRLHGGCTAVRSRASAAFHSVRLSPAASRRASDSAFAAAFCFRAFSAAEAAAAAGVAARVSQLAVSNPWGDAAAGGGGAGGGAGGAERQPWQCGEVAAGGWPSSVGQAAAASAGPSGTAPPSEASATPRPAGARPPLRLDEGPIGACSPHSVTTFLIWQARSRSMST